MSPAKRALGTAKATVSDIIDLDWGLTDSEDDEDEELRKAIQLSLGAAEVAPCFEGPLAVVGGRADNHPSKEMLNRLGPSAYIPPNSLVHAVGFASSNAPASSTANEPPDSVSAVNALDSPKAAVAEVRAARLKFFDSGSYTCTGSTPTLASESRPEPTKTESSKGGGYTFSSHTPSCGRGSN